MVETTLRNKTIVHAAAFGFVYFDDGVSAKKNVSVTDFTYKFGISSGEKT